jgi:hypothetical protein
MTTQMTLKDAMTAVGTGSMTAADYVATLTPGLVSTWRQYSLYDETKDQIKGYWLILAALPAKQAEVIRTVSAAEIAAHVSRGRSVDVNEDNEEA